MDTNENPIVHLPNFTQMWFKGLKLRKIDGVMWFSDLVCHMLNKF